MKRVEEIEQAIDQLPQGDEQLDADAASGKLDFLFEEAEAESTQGPLREWPPSK